MRKPRSPRPSISSPALTSPGTGLTNTDPQFCPPGWCSRRQRTISATRAAASTGVARGAATAEPRARRRAVRAASHGSGARAARGPTCTRRPNACRATASRRRRAPSSMSEPWPPAFMCTAPPIEPGMPTAHSKPGESRRCGAPGEHGERHRAAGRDRRAVRRRRRLAEVDVATPCRRATRRCPRTPRRRRACSNRARRRAAGVRRRAGPRRRAGGRRSTRADEQCCRPTDAIRGVRRQRLVTRRQRRRAGGRRARRRRGSSASRHLRTAVTGGAAPRRGGRRCRHIPSRCTRRRHRTSSATKRITSSRRGSHTTRARRVGVEHGVDDQLAGHARDRRRARGVDIGDHDHVGVDERVGVLAPHLGDAVIAVRLEHGDDPLPPVAAARGPRRARRRSRRADGRSRRRTSPRRRHRGRRSGAPRLRTGRAPTARRRTAHRRSSAIAAAPAALATLWRPRSGRAISPNRDRRRSQREREPAGLGDGIDHPVVGVVVEPVRDASRRPARRCAPALLVVGARAPADRAPARRSGRTRRRCPSNVPYWSRWSTSTLVRIVPCNGQFEVGAVALVGLDDQPLPTRPLCAGAHVGDVATDDEARSQTRVGEDQHQHRRRRRLAVRSGDGQRLGLGADRRQDARPAQDRDPVPRRRPAARRCGPGSPTRR